jgi:hypothetical protein
VLNLTEIIFPSPQVFAKYGYFSVIVYLFTLGAAPFWFYSPTMPEGLHLLDPHLLVATFHTFAAFTDHSSFST